jgi:CDP-glucose 4,6-dehydratase
VPGTFRSLLRGEQPVLRSDGTFVRDYLHVDDIVSAYLTLGERPITLHLQVKVLTSVMSLR